jgi:hypothetical protein
MSRVPVKGTALIETSNKNDMVREKSCCKKQTAITK